MRPFADRFYVGNDLESIGRAVEGVQQFSVELNVHGVSAAYQMLPDDDVILADATSAAFTVTLPNVVDAYLKTYTIKRLNAGGNAVTIEENGELIDGAGLQTLAAQWDSITVVPHKVLTVSPQITTWYII